MWPWTANQLLKTALRLYAGNHVLSRVLAEGKAALELGGDCVELTLVFIDIAGVNYSENPPENAIAPFVNLYLQVVTDSVQAHGGVIDSYTGDSVFAWWHEAKNACLCAKRIVEEVEILSTNSQSAKLPTIKVGIGINTGIVTLGNYGSSHRIKFTVLGDNVNLASRLCSTANKNYPVPIVISASTQQLVAGTMETKMLGTVQVKGREDPLELFSL